MLIEEPLILEYPWDVGAKLLVDVEHLVKGPVRLVGFLMVSGQLHATAPMTQEAHCGM